MLHAVFLEALEGHYDSSTAGEGTGEAGNMAQTEI
jgi:hypothetical protein